MMLVKHAHRLRSLVPRAARERLYEWHPGRARRWRQYPGIEEVPAAGHAVLTFDDGPDRDGTSAVLDALDQANAQATFFVIGSQLELYPDLGREIVGRGHEIGLHGYRHERHDRIDPARSRENVITGYKVVEDILGVSCRWYRPPYGKMSVAAAEACHELGLTTVYWSAWGLDWEETPARRIADVVASQLDGGAVVLLHDSAKFGRRATAAATAHAIPTIAGRARERGISFSPLGSALAAAGAMVT